MRLHSHHTFGARLPGGPRPIGSRGPATFGRFLNDIGSIARRARGACVGVVVREVVDGDVDGFVDTVVVGDDALFAVVVGACGHLPRLPHAAHLKGQRLSAMHRGHLRAVAVAGGAVVVHRSRSAGLSVSGRSEHLGQVFPDERFQGGAAGRDDGEVGLDRRGAEADAECWVWIGRRGEKGLDENDHTVKSYGGDYET